MPHLFAFGHGNTVLSSGVVLQNLPWVVIVGLVSVVLCWGISNLINIFQCRANHLDKHRSQNSIKERSNARHDDETKPEIRIFMDGAFDMMHFGHMNAFRLGRSLGTYLIVGVNSDESITECKGPPLMNEQERITMVQSCKFVDEVIPNCPYVMSVEYLNWVINTYNIDYVVHGDDPCIVDGKDVYATAKEMGKFRTIPRTLGVSSTDIVGRMLLATRNLNEYNTNSNNESNSSNTNGYMQKYDGSESSTSHVTCISQQSKFLTTTSLIHLFFGTNDIPSSTINKENNRRIIYIDGAWDLFHPGHVAILQAAKKRGDFLIVGIHNDTVVNRIYGKNYPIMNLHERVLSVIGCRFVDDVLIDAPFCITRDLITTLRVDEVLRLTNDKNVEEQFSIRYQHATDEDILSDLNVASTFSGEQLLDRIQRHSTMFIEKFERKSKSEQEYMVNNRMNQLKIGPL